MDGVEAHAAADADSRRGCRPVKDARWRGACGVDGGLVDLGLGLAGSDAAGKNLCGEVAHESEMGQLIFDVERVGVGEEQQAAALREASEK